MQLFDKLMLIYSREDFSREGGPWMDYAEKHYLE
jgi:hypothetical protein